MNLFKKKFLVEALRREKSLRKQFLSVGPMNNVPHFLINPLKRLLQQELKNLT